MRSKVLTFAKLLACTVRVYTLSLGKSATGSAKVPGKILPRAACLLISENLSRVGEGGQIHSVPLSASSPKCVPQWGFAEPRVPAGPQQEHPAGLEYCPAPAVGEGQLAQWTCQKVSSSISFAHFLILSSL